MQLAKCLVLVVASVLAAPGASTSDGASLGLRSQHSLESSLRSKAYQRADCFECLTQTSTNSFPDE